MNYLTKFPVLFLLLILIQTVSGQTDSDLPGKSERNWWKDTRGIDNPNSEYDFKQWRYTREDVEAAIRRFQLIKSRSFNNDEWEGTYSMDSMTGYHELFWNSAGGFVESYYYHTLVSINSDNVQTSTDSVTLIFPKRSVNSVLVKVKFGDRHLLVPEDNLGQFTELAVGLSDFKSSDNPENKFYYKVDDEKKDIYGIPVLPKKYKSFVRHPVRAEITQVSHPRFEQDKGDDGTIFSEYNEYKITLSVGSNHKVKKGAQFYIEDISDWLIIEDVTPTRSSGKIIRYLNEDRQEECTEQEISNDKEIPCIQIRRGMKAISQIDERFL